MSAIQIRPVIASDLPHLMGMDHSASSEYVWQLELRKNTGQVVAGFREVRLPRPIQLTYPRDPFSLADEWKRMAMMYAAIFGSDPVGYTAMIERPTLAVWITDLVVSSVWRRKGAASALLSSAEEWGRGRGLRKVFLEMQSKNHAGIRLAQKHGYEFCGYNDHYYMTQDIALFFARVL